VGTEGLAESMKKNHDLEVTTTKAHAPATPKHRKDRNQDRKRPTQTEIKTAKTLKTPTQTFLAHHN
jgi:hypothetical protein